MKRVCLVKSEICDAYTRIFGTRQEPQKFIKFSDSSGNILIKFSPFYRNCIYSVQGTLCHCEERSDVAIPRKGHGTPCKSDDAMFLPVGKSDVAFGAMCAFDTFRINLCHSEERSDVRIPRKGTILKTTQDTFVLAWRNVAQKKHAVGRVFESLFVLPCYLPTNPLMASSISL